MDLKPPDSLNRQFLNQYDPIERISNDLAFGFYTLELETKDKMFNFKIGFELKG